MKQISWWRTTYSEEERNQVLQAMIKEHISQGPITEEFEAQFAEILGVPYALATTSGSVALLMAMIALDIGPGDEVILPNRTWIATAHCVVMLGAKVVLVDVIKEAPIIKTIDIREKINSRTKAIIPVHLSGRSAEMNEILKIAKKHGIFVVEDACQSLFSKNDGGFLGTQSDIGCFSLGVTKIISTAQGGMLVTHNKDLFEKLKLIRSHGTTTNITPVYSQIGCNFKFTDIQAAIGISQLSRKEEKIDHVNKIYMKYSKAIKSLSKLEIIPVKVEEGEVPLFLEILCDQRSEFMNFLKLKGIETRPFLPCLDSAKYLKNKDIFPNSKIFNDHGIFLPCGPSQPLDKVDQVIVALREYSSR